MPLNITSLVTTSLMSFLSEYTSNLVSFFEAFSKFFISTLSLINDDKKGLVETLTFEFNFSS